jgi:hypothetical protein
MTKNMRPADAELWNAETALEPTPTELIEHVATDMEYARKQLSNAERAHTMHAVQDCISRAQDALERVADVHAQLIVSLATPSAQEPQDWTIDEILAHAG